MREFDDNRDNRGNNYDDCLFVPIVFYLSNNSV